MHRAEVFGGIQHDLSVAGPSPVGRRWIHFRLPKWEPVPTDNPAILELYRATDGTLLSRDAFATSGWVACANVVHVESYDTEYDAPRDPALLLFRSDTGDQLYAVGDVMHVLLHETGEKRPIGAVDAIIRSYFEADLTDGRWDSFPG